MSTDRAELVRRWVDQYRAWGWQPLPSDPLHKKPLVKFAAYWDRPMPDPFARAPWTTRDARVVELQDVNLQIMTGCHWGLLVIDLDGPEAVQKWESLALGRVPRTWVVRSGSGGRHLWFRTPQGLKALPTARLWGEWDSELNSGRGGFTKGKAIERLCDHKLVMAHPSVHPETRALYQFERGCSPMQITRPAEVPDWVLRLPVVEAPRVLPVVVPAAVQPRPAGLDRTRRSASEILDAVPEADRVALARSWGLRLARDTPNGDGWFPCHCVDREDRQPSASFSARTGRYWSSETGRKGISFLELGVVLGAWPTLRDGLDILSARYCPRV